jgi:hypothetical protein
MGEINQKGPTAFICTMNHPKTWFSTDISAGAIMSGVQYLAPLRYRGARNIQGLLGGQHLIEDVRGSR